MQQFIQRHGQKIEAVLSTFDRLIFKGHLTVVNFPEAMEGFLAREGVLHKDFGRFVLKQAERLKRHAKAYAARTGRPYQHLDDHRLRMDEEARKRAQRNGVQRGLICVFTKIETCRSYRLRYGEGKPRLSSARRKCLFLYFYFMDREFGLMHVRLQTWFPFEIQVYINGHSWLARKMDRHGLRYRHMENTFFWLEDPRRAQRLADNMVRQNWPRVLDAFARRVNPLLRDLFQGYGYYWVTDQAEYSTDILFKDAQALQGLYPEWLRHATLCLSADDVLSFLGKKLHPLYQGEVHTDFKKRQPGARVKHRMNENWIKMYDKFRRVLRIETVINHPRDFKIFRRAKKKGKIVLGWYPMAKRVTSLWRYRQVSLQANTRYLEALATVEDTSVAKRTIEKACKRTRLNGRSIRALNPLAQDDLQLFAAVVRGEHTLLGFRNRNIRSLLFGEAKNAADRRRNSSRTSRLFKRLHAHGLIRKIPHSRRWRVTRKGQALMSTALNLGKEYFPQQLTAQAA